MSGEMTSREKFLAACEFKKAPPPKWEFGYWGETIDNWYDQGLMKKQYPEIDRDITTPTRSMFLPAWQTVQGGKLPKGIAVMAGGLYWPTQGFPLDHDVRSAFSMDHTQELADVNGLACQRIDEFLGPIERTLRTGGYIPYGDHFIPPEVDFENFTYYRNKLNEIIDKAGG